MDRIDTLEEKGKNVSGTVFEQQVKLNSGLTLRRIVIKLDKPTRHNEEEVWLLTNLPEEVDALTVSNLYIERWRIEKMFQVITDNFNCEIKTLGYPRAALFVFCMAMVAFNILSVIRGAMKEVHGEEKIEAELSNYYVAKEVQRNFSGMEIAVTAEEWKEFDEMSEAEFAKHLKNWAKKVELQKFRSSPRGEKKPVKKENFSPKHPHIATFKLLSIK